MLKIKYLLFKLSIKWQMIRGYIGKDLEPKKCPYCKHKKFKKGESYSEDIWGFNHEVEFVIYCEKCGKQVGHYAYGSWVL